MRRAKPDEGDAYREHSYPDEFEGVILLTILRLGDDVYGVALSKELSILRGRALPSAREDPA